MGYDMTWHTIPEDLQQAQKKLDETYDYESPEYRALQERNTAHLENLINQHEEDDTILITSLPELTEWWAQRFEAEDEIGTYFRLSIHGMARYREAMYHLNMLNTNEPLYSNDPDLRIPFYKLSSNDDWHVTPDEINATLAAYNEYVKNAGIERDTWAPFPLSATKNGRDYWLSWLRFLERAATLGEGFIVR